MTERDNYAESIRARSENRRPLNFEGRWLWHNGDHRLAEKDGDYGDHLPAEVFYGLTGFMPKANERATDLVRAYPTREEAYAAYQLAKSRLPS